jgi:hypothetical protein
MEILTPLADVPIKHMSHSEIYVSPIEAANNEALQRNSMVSVRLSDPRSSIQQKLPSIAQKLEPTQKLEPSRVRFEDDEEQVSVGPKEHTIESRELEAPLDADKAVSYNCSSPTESVVELESDDTPVHVRTGSIDSSVSDSSTHVDWEVLDKNEEQKQRDEGSDAVRTSPLSGM